MKRHKVFILLVVLIALFSIPRAIFAAGDPCKFAGDDAGACSACMSKDDAVWTAIGCLPTDSGAFVEKILKSGSGIAGGIAFLLIIVGGFKIVMSAGNPEKLNEGKELVTSAIVGLLFIIFSIFLLRLIGVDILAIPGFE